eukprot:m.649623 g.649623  ORF g.649623 m.649623 type:complete len:127 (-) comp58390_c0_seq34:3116-3496(-)
MHAQFTTAIEWHIVFALPPIVLSAFPIFAEVPHATLIVSSLTHSCQSSPQRIPSSSPRKTTWAPAILARRSAISGQGLLRTKFMSLGASAFSTESRMIVVTSTRALATPEPLIPRERHMQKHGVCR